MNPAKKTMKIFLAQLLVLIIPVAVFCASPSKINYQGRLLDNVGSPVNSETTVSFGFFRDKEKTDQLNSANPELTTFYVTPVNGFFSQTIDVDPNWFIGGDVYMDVSVGGNPLGDPQLLVSAPYALAVAENSIGKNEINSSSLAKVYKTVDGHLVLGEMLEIDGEPKLGYKSAACRYSDGFLSYIRYFGCDGGCPSDYTTPVPCELTDADWVGSLILK
jgi:hypothetical protein